MSAPVASGLGKGTGWLVDGPKDGTWTWSAYGPKGTETGTAPSAAEAQRQARSACERVKAAYAQVPEATT